MNILLTVTGLYHDDQVSACSDIFLYCPTGTKFVLLTSLAETVADTVLQKIYDIYADAVMKNPFHTPEMPIRNEGFDTRINSLIGTAKT